MGTLGTRCALWAFGTGDTLRSRETTRATQSTTFNNVVVVATTLTLAIVLSWVHVAVRAVATKHCFFLLEVNLELRPVHPTQTAKKLLQIAETFCKVVDKRLQRAYNVYS